jgi:hypothetical protein
LYSICELHEWLDRGSCLVLCYIFIELHQNYEEIGPRNQNFGFASCEHSKTASLRLLAPITAGGHDSAVLFTAESEISMLS